MTTPRTATTFYRLEATGTNRANFNRMRSLGTVVLGKTITLQVRPANFVERTGVGRPFARFDSVGIGFDIRGNHWLLMLEDDATVTGMMFTKTALTNIQPSIVDLDRKLRDDIQHCVLWKSKHLLWFVVDGDQSSSQLYIHGYVQAPAAGEPIHMTVHDDSFKAMHRGMQTIPVSTTDFETNAYRNNEADRQFIQRFPETYQSMVLARQFLLRSASGDELLPHVLICERSICTNSGRNFQSIEPEQARVDPVPEVPISCHPSRYLPIDPPSDGKKC